MMTDEIEKEEIGMFVLGALILLGCLAAVASAIILVGRLVAWMS